MTLRLYPRLAAMDAHIHWEHLRELPQERLRDEAACTHPAETFASTGGIRVTRYDLVRLGSAIREIAGEHGYPGRRTVPQASAFDSEVAVWLAEKLDMVDGEALRPETWAFVSLCILPDVVRWRFPEFHQSRCMGGRRDCFQRLWLRARAFDLGPEAKDRWRLLSVLTEDAFVSIMERPSLAESPSICKTIGLVWFHTSTQIKRSNMEAINRLAIKILRSQLTLFNLEFMEYSEIKQMVQGCYGDSMAMLGRSQ